MVFLDKLIDYVSDNGYVKTRDVFDNTPFDKPKYMYEMFEMPQIVELFHIVDSFGIMRWQERMLSNDVVLTTPEVLGILYLNGGV